MRLWQALSALYDVDPDSGVIAETDQILAALYPVEDLPTDTADASNDAANRTLLDQGFAVMLKRLGFLQEIMTLLGLTPAASLQQLLACWAPIGSFGAGAL